MDPGAKRPLAICFLFSEPFSLTTALIYNRHTATVQMRAQGHARTHSQGSAQMLYVNKTHTVAIHG